MVGTVQVANSPELLRLLRFDDGRQVYCDLLMQDGKFDVNNRQKLSGITSLMLACERGDVEVVALLLSHPDIDVNCQTQLGRTALMLAVMKGHYDVVKTLLGSKGINLNQRSALDGSTALIMATSRKDIRMVDLLLSCGDIDLNLSTSIGWTALMLGCYENMAPVVERLLREPQLDVHKKNKSGSDALMMASLRENSSIACMLLAHSSSLKLPCDCLPSRVGNQFQEEVVSRAIANLRLYRRIVLSREWGDKLSSDLLARIVGMAFGNEIILLGSGRSDFTAITRLLCLVPGYVYKKQI